MSDQFVAEIRIVPFNFAPSGWALCNGQILPISQNTALFSLLGVNYGGNGTSNFGLPNLQGMTAIGTGQGPGLSSYATGYTGGQAAVTLVQSQMPAHSHTARGAIAGAQDSPTNNYWGESKSGKTALNAYAPSASNTNTQMNSSALSLVGNSNAHNNMPPYLTLNFVIAMQGIFPPRS